MADIPGWLRGFQRARIPNATTPADRFSLLGEINEATEEMQGALSTSRVSYQNFGRPTAPSLPAESQRHLNQVEQIWHNPDPDQMAETLKVAMMTQSSFDPLHVPFNSCILHVLEAYHHMQRELIEKEREIRNREERHENDIKEFRLQQLRWKGKEDEYKSEVKKLEVMLATGARGLELVTLARTRSALNETMRAGATESQQVEKENELQHVASDIEPMMSDFAEREDSITSAGFTSQRRILNASHNHGALIPRQSRRSEVPITIGQSTGGTKYENENNNVNSDTTCFEQLYHMAHSETSSKSLSGLEQESERCREQHARPLRGRASNRTYVERIQIIKDSSKPLPEAPTSPKQTSARDSSEEEEEEGGLYDGEKFIGKSVTHHRGFSFIPGDDFGNLDFGRAKAQATVQALDCYGNNGRPASSFLSSNNEFTDPIPAKKHRRKGPVLGEEREANAVRERKLTTGCDLQPMRSDSQISIATVPDQYAGSSKGLERVKDAPNRPKPSRLTGSNEATIAAVRAIAESGKFASKGSLDIIQ